jgi:hypothetical protein
MKKQIQKDGKEMRGMREVEGEEWGSNERI